MPSKTPDINTNAKCSSHH